LAVCSALHGVTDLLLRGAREAATGDGESFRTIAGELRQRHAATGASLVEGSAAGTLDQRIGLLIAEYESLCHAVHVLGEASARALDAIGSLGERMSAPLVAASLLARGVAAASVDATACVVTDDRFGEAAPDMEASRTRATAVLVPLLERGTIPVVTGFIGATRRGAVTTLGRGGSDYSAAILGAALDAQAVIIWTDVPGVMTADPRVVPSARTISTLSFREVSELAYYGAKVIHPRTIRPVIERGIELWIRNTFDPANPGTRIVLDAKRGTGIVKAVTAIPGQSLVTLEGRGMVGVRGVAGRTFAAVSAAGASAAFITQSSSEQTICFTVPTSRAGQVREALGHEFERELSRRDIDSITVRDDMVIVTVVGAGMMETPGVAGRVFTALGKAGVNVIAIAQGSSEVSISMIVTAADAGPAVRAVHDLTT
ncbi:MAG TPA: aspartate kinase, partial [Gemmatimonadales bacterium]|nr:aspartate kinase [Gemmatimonadales bacterium]